MTLPKSISAYKDCEEYFEKALRAEKGIAVELTDAKAATVFRHKMNTYRSKLRKQSQDIYEVGDARRGASPYDGLQLVLDPKNSSRVFIQPYELKVKGVEELK